MESNAEQTRDQQSRSAPPTAERHAKFAGDATGAVGGTVAPPVAPDTLPHDAQTPDAHRHDPGKPSHEVEDDGWVKEGQGSQLAHEREGVPEGEMPHNMPESAARPRPKA